MGGGLSKKHQAAANQDELVGQEGFDRHTKQHRKSNVSHEDQTSEDHNDEKYGRKKEKATKPELKRQRRISKTDHTQSEGKERRKNSSAASNSVSHRRKSHASDGSEVQPHSRRKSTQHTKEVDAADEVMNLIGHSQTSPTPRTRAVESVVRRTGDAADQVIDLIEILSDANAFHKPKLIESDWFHKRREREARRQSETCLVAEKAMSQSELEDLEKELDALDQKAAEANDTLSQLNNLTPKELEQQRRVRDGSSGPSGVPPPVRYKLMLDRENEGFKQRVGPPEDYKQRVGGPTSRYSSNNVATWD